MGWFDHQESNQESKEIVQESSIPEIEIQLPGGDGSYVLLNKNQCDRIYKDDLGGALFLVIDEVAELLMPEKVKTPEGKETDRLKQECVMLIQSITQLGRAAGIHCVLATQRNDTTIIPGVIQNNPLSLDTKLRVLRGPKGQENEIIINIGDLYKYDKVMGTDGSWHDINLQDIHIPDKMYKLTFTTGFFEENRITCEVKCSGDHKWMVYDNMNCRMGVFTTYELLSDPFTMLYNIGVSDGPMISRVEEIEPEPVRCLEVLGTEDNQFEILGMNFSKEEM